jgi:hypothetical protein
VWLQLTERQACCKHQQLPTYEYLVPHSKTTWNTTGKIQQSSWLEGNKFYLQK